MALDAAQILRQTYASGAERIDVASLMRQTEPQAVARGELMGTAVVLQEDPMAELMDSMEELSFQFEEKTAKRVAERRLGEMQGPRSALVKAIETWMSMMPDMPGRDFITRLARGLRSAAGAGNLPDARELLKELARGSTDPSHQFAMLDILEQAFGVGIQGCCRRRRRLSQWRSGCWAVPRRQAGNSPKRRLPRWSHSPPGKSKSEFHSR